jgi:dipeptidyl aminopeptidase/acylaminoacyl peptidase
MSSFLLRSSFLAISVALHASLFGASSVDRDKLIDDLFKPPEIYKVKLSPDGATLGFQSFFKGYQTLSTVDMTSLKVLGHVAGEFDGEGIGSFHWADAAHVVYVITKYPQWFKHLISANRTLGSRMLLIPDYYHVRMFDSTPYSKNDVLIAWQRSDDLYDDIMRLDITSQTDSMSSAAHNPGDFVDFHADLEGLVRIGYKKRSDGYTDAYHRWTEKEEWQKLPLPDRAYVASFSATGDSVLVVYPDGEGGRWVLQSYDLKTAKLIGPPMADPVYNIWGSTVRDSQTRQIVGYVYDADRPKTIWFDADYARLHKAVRAKMPGLTHWFHGYTATGELLVESGSDVQPSLFWLLDMKTLAGRSFKKSMPWINPEKMRPMEPVHFAARDGAMIHGYLTKPAGTSVKPAPLLLSIHGGPHARDEWGFDEEVQFFAALGYSVLQVNYRGSSGFGEKYELPTELDVARVSVDDVADAVKWAVDSGLADPKRVAIYGISYGGYIALASATRYPDMYRCAMGFAGVYDWEKHFSRKTEDGGSFWDWQAIRYGDWKKNPEKFRPYSPVHFASAIKCPIWLGHGGADQVVFTEQTKEMAAALEAAKKPFELHLDTWGVHGFRDLEKERIFYRSLSDFLLKYLPVE